MQPALLRSHHLLQRRAVARLFVGVAQRGNPVQFGVAGGADERERRQGVGDIIHDRSGPPRWGLQRRSGGVSRA
ncbi:hypothetical protein V8017_22825 [Stenotrophomonas rhizophila]